MQTQQTYPIQTTGGTVFHMVLMHNQTVNVRKGFIYLRNNISEMQEEQADMQAVLLSEYFMEAYGITNESDRQLSAELEHEEKLALITLWLTESARIESIEIEMANEVALFITAWEDAAERDKPDKPKRKWTDWLKS